MHFLPLEVPVSEVIALASYLLKTERGYILVDSGSSFSRSELEKELEMAGCRRGDFQLVVITHGDFDHTGSAAYLRRIFGAKIAMHHDNSGMAEHGDMFWNRGKSSFLIKLLAPLLFGFGKAQRFQADLYFEDGASLADYGLEAKIICLPGHSRGSIGILTGGGDLFCGDLLMNDRGKPGLGFGDAAIFKGSLEKLAKLEIHTVYPGHGEPFLSACIDGIQIGARLGGEEEPLTWKEQ